MSQRAKQFEEMLKRTQEPPPSPSDLKSRQKAIDLEGLSGQRKITIGGVRPNAQFFIDHQNRDPVVASDPPFPAPKNPITAPSPPSETPNNHPHFPPGSPQVFPSGNLFFEPPSPGLHHQVASSSKNPIPSPKSEHSSESRPVPPRRIPPQVASRTSREVLHKNHSFPAPRKSSLVTKPPLTPPSLTQLRNKISAEFKPQLSETSLEELEPYCGPIEETVPSSLSESTFFHDTNRPPSPSSSSSSEITITPYSHKLLEQKNFYSVPSIPDHILNKEVLPKIRPFTPSHAQQPPHPQEKQEGESPNDIFTFGSNTHGQLGTDSQEKQSYHIINPASSSRIKTISAGTFHSCFVTDDDEIFLCGLHQSPEDGSTLFTSSVELTPVFIPKFIDWCKPVIIKQMELGDHHTLLLTQDGDLFAWGSNKHGQLACKILPLASEPISIPLKCLSSISCGANHCAALTDWGEAYTWGYNSDGQLGVGDTDTRFEPIKIGKLRTENIIGLTCGSKHTACFTTNNQVFIWGYNTGSFPVEMSPAPILNEHVCYTKIACEENSTILLTNSGEVVVYYLSSSQPLTVQGFNGNSVAMISSGMEHTVCVCDNGMAYSFGNNNFRQLGHEQSLSIQNPPSPPPSGFGAEMKELAGELPPKHLHAYPISFLDSSPKDTPIIVNAAAGKHHTILVTESSPRFAPCINILTHIRSHFRLLNVLVSVYMKKLSGGLFSLPGTKRRDTIISLPPPMTRKKSVDMSAEKDHIFSDEEFDAIFNNVIDLLEFMKDLLAAVEVKMDNWNEKECFGDVLNSVLVISTFKKYVEYADRYNMALSTFTRAAENSQSLEDRVKELETLAKSYNLSPEERMLIDVKQLLLRPILFIPKMVVLIKALMKQTPPLHPDNFLLIKAKKRFKQLLVRTNENFQFSNPGEILNCTTDAHGNLQIIADHLNGLVDRLTHHNITDTNFRDVFFLTYRTFTTPHTLMEALITRYQSSVSKNESWNTRHRIFQAISAWLMNQFEDFEQSAILCHLFDEFVGMENFDTEGSKFALHLRKSFESQRILRSNELEKRKASFNPLISPKKLETKTLRDFSSSPHEIAEVMALIDHAYLQNIDLGEFFYAHKNDESLSPGIFKFTERFNDISRWVCTQVVQCKKTRHKVQTMQLFINIAMKSFELKDLLGYCGIVCGLSSSSLSREKKAWSKLPKDSTHIYEDMIKCISPLRNYYNLRRVLHQKDCKGTPAVPFLAITIKDLTFIQEIPNQIDGMINFYKRRRIAEILTEIKNYKSLSYCFKKIPPQLHYSLLHLNPLSWEELQNFKSPIVKNV